MRPARWVLRLALGARRPVTAGTLTVAGVHAAVQIHRDRYGIPIIEADGDEDAAFGVGFCQGQDRTFQLEMLHRAVRGTLAELVGPQAVAVDRLARRIDFRRRADESLAAGGGRAGALLDAFTRGITAGALQGLRRRPHELALLRAQPSAWSPADVIGVARLMAFVLPTNWDQEFVRLKLIVDDGPEAVRVLECPYPPDAPAHDAPGKPAGAVVDALAEELDTFAQTVRMGGASNAWALSGDRTATGRPLLAGDTHLSPTVPPHWYLVQVRTPEHAVAGAVYAGTPSVLAGHNGRGAWSMTIAPMDTTDLVIEEISGGAVRRGPDLIACRRRRETITVRGAEPVEIEIVETPDGPIISPELPDSSHALALRATWLQPHPVDGLLFGIQRAGSFAEFRDQASGWGGVPFNFVWADTTGTIGWQTVCRVPRRHGTCGAFPGAGWAPETGWGDEHLPFAELPWLQDPAVGFVVSANHLPTAADAENRFGRDWLDGYRARRIEMVLDTRSDWDVAGCQRLQLDDLTLSWWELRDHVLAAPVTDGDGHLGRELLAAWGGRLAADRVGATVFTFLVAELTRRLVGAAAPRSRRWALGAGVSPLTPANHFPKRYRALLVRMIREHDPGPLQRPWPDEIADALTTVVGTLRSRFGPDPAGWRWGEVAAWEIPHALGARRPLGRVFNLGPLSGAGDMTTPAQHARSLVDPALPPLSYPALRMVVDLADWDASRFALPGGQSGNPLSPHYEDQLPAYLDGSGVPLPWTAPAVRGATRETLVLAPPDTGEWPRRAG